MGPRLWFDSVELLIFLFAHANITERRKLVFIPNPEKDLNIEKRPEVSNLLYWLSDRFPVVCRLPPRFRIDELITRNQYILPPVPSQKEERFRRAKESVGGKTFFAFHGSRVQNWYSIMFEGLQVCSGTDREMVGHLYGKGIYLTKQPMISAKYSRKMCANIGMPNGTYCGVYEHRKSCSHLSGGTWCIGLCEVVDDPSKFTEKGYGTPYYVLTDPDYVQVRGLFVYGCDSDAFIPDLEADSLNIGGGIHTKMNRALSFFSKAGFRERIAAILDSNGDDAKYPDDEDLLVLPVDELE